jgi:hypothetical protein
MPHWAVVTALELAVFGVALSCVDEYCTMDRRPKFSAFWSNKYGSQPVMLILLTLREIELPVGDATSCAARGSRPRIDAYRLDFPIGHESSLASLGRVRPALVFRFAATFCERRERHRTPLGKPCQTFGR